MAAPPDDPLLIYPIYYKRGNYPNKAPSQIWDFHAQSDSKFYWIDRLKEVIEFTINDK